jgi:hypothetical protein
MLTRTLLASLLLLAAACTTSLSRSTDSSAVGVTAVAANQSESESAKGLDVDITQPDSPPLFPNATTANVRYVFKIANRGTEPATIKRITVWSNGGSYDLDPLSSRTFNKTIAPGATEELQFWAKAINLDPGLGLSGPMSVRAEIRFQEPSGDRKATFVRDVGGRIGVGVGSRP